MTLTITLARVGSSRVAEHNIPLQARILQGGRYGENLLPGSVTDVEYAKTWLTDSLNNKFCREVEILWDDQTK